MPATIFVLLPKFSDYMDTIKIGVSKQMDGLTFSILPSARDLVKHLIPGAYPANNIFVAYDTKSNFDLYYVTLEKWIMPALLGVSTREDLNKIYKIEFVDTQTGQTLHQITPHDQEA